jgi:hypothetical protein
MENFRRIALAGVINLTVAGISDVYAATDAKGHGRLRATYPGIGKPFGKTGPCGCIEVYQ